MRDLATVQGLVSQLLRYDAVTFLTLLEGVRLSEAGSSIWLLHEATHIMYQQVCNTRRQLGCTGILKEDACSCAIKSSCMSAKMAAGMLQ